MSLPESAAPYWGFRAPAGGMLQPRQWLDPHWIYVIASGRDEQPVKIGISGNIQQRIKTFEAGNPYGLRLLHSRRVCRVLAPQIERRLHQLFSERALGREWFDMSAAEAMEPLEVLARRARHAANRFLRDLEIAEMRAERVREAMEEEARQQEWLAAQNYERQHNHRLAMERRVMTNRGHQVPLSHQNTRKPRRPAIPDGVNAPTGTGRKATLERYKLARGIVD